MSNRVCFVLTKFVDLDDDLAETGVNYGYRIYDDYQASYNNCLEQSELPKTAKAAWDLIQEWEPNFAAAIIDKGGFVFDNGYYELDSDGEVI